MEGYSAEFPEHRHYSQIYSNNLASLSSEDRHIHKNP